MKRNALIHLLAFCVATAVVSAQTLPNGGIFDICRSVTIEGKVQRVHWTYPRILIDLKTDDGTEYRLDWITLKELKAAGVAGPGDKQKLKSKDRVAITGSPRRQSRTVYPGLLPDPVLTTYADRPIHSSAINAAEIAFDSMLIYPSFSRPDMNHLGFLTQIRRVSDSWSWTGTPPPSPPQCARP